MYFKILFSLQYEFDLIELDFLSFAVAAQMSAQLSAGRGLPMPPMGMGMPPRPPMPGNTYTFNNIESYSSRSPEL